MKSAAASFRAEGVKGATIPGIMERAELTVGGFYKHFGSKSELFQEIVRTAMDRTRDQLRRIPETGRAWRSAAAAVYLSKAHRQNMEGGCPIPALAPDIARSDEDTRHTFEEAISDLVDDIATRMDTGDATRDREAAWAFISTQVGGLTLARAMADDALAAEVLRACRHELAR